MSAQSHPIDTNAIIGIKGGRRQGRHMPDFRSWPCCTGPMQSSMKPLAATSAGLQPAGVLQDGDRTSPEAPDRRGIRGGSERTGAVHAGGTGNPSTPGPTECQAGRIRMSCGIRPNAQPACPIRAGAGSVARLWKNTRQRSGHFATTPLNRQIRFLASMSHISFFGDSAIRFPWAPGSLRRYHAPCLEFRLRVIRPGGYSGANMWRQLSRLAPTPCQRKGETDCQDRHRFKVPPGVFPVPGAQGAPAASRGLPSRFRSHRKSGQRRGPG